MDLQAEKIELVKLLLEVEDEHILNEVKAVLTDEHVFYEDTPEYVKAEINQSLKEAESGNLRDHEDVMKDMKKKYGLKG
ncbi:MAG: hypothetical protein ABIN95_13005 [Mucilaginibacter sp.]